MSDAAHLSPGRPDASRSGKRDAPSPLLSSPRITTADDIQRLQSLDFAALADTANSVGFATLSYGDSMKIKQQSNHEFYSDFFVSQNAEIIKAVGENHEDLLDAVGDSLMCPSDDLAYGPPFRTISSGWKEGIVMMNQGTSLDDNDHVAIDLVNICDPFDERHFEIDYMQLMSDMNSGKSRTAPAASKVAAKKGGKKVGLTLPMEIIESANKQRDNSIKKSGGDKQMGSPKKKLLGDRKGPGRPAGSRGNGADRQSTSRKMSDTSYLDDDDDDDAANLSIDMTYENSISSPLEAGWGNVGRISDTVYHGVRARRRVNPDSFQDGDELICEEVGSMGGGNFGRGKYRCGRCGKPKNNHECEYGEECAVSSQSQQWCVDIVDQSTMQPFGNEYFLSVSSRKSIFENIEKRKADYVYVPSGRSRPNAPIDPSSSSSSIQSELKGHSQPSSVPHRHAEGLVLGAGYAVDESGNFFFVDGKGNAFKLILGEDGSYYHDNAPIAITATTDV